MINNKKEFKCAACGGIFERDNTEEDTEEELKKNYPGYTKEECGIVCDDCYNLPFFVNLRGKKR